MNKFNFIHLEKNEKVVLESTHTYNKPHTHTHTHAEAHTNTHEVIGSNCDAFGANLPSLINFAKFKLVKFLNLQHSPSGISVYES